MNVGKIYILHSINSPGYRYAQELLNLLIILGILKSITDILAKKAKAT
jgi:hypothetical protein